MEEDSKFPEGLGLSDSSDSETSGSETESDGEEDFGGIRSLTHAPEGDLQGRRSPMSSTFPSVDPTSLAYLQKRHDLKKMREERRLATLSLRTAGRFAWEDECLFSTDVNEFLMYKELVEFHLYRTRFEKEGKWWDRLRASGEDAERVSRMSCLLEEVEVASDKVRLPALELMCFLLYWVGGDQKGQTDVEKRADIVHETATELVDLGALPIILQQFFLREAYMSAALTRKKASESKKEEKEDKERRKDKVDSGGDDDEEDDEEDDVGEERKKKKKKKKNLISPWTTDSIDECEFAREMRLLCNIIYPLILVCLEDGNDEETRDILDNFRFDDKPLVVLFLELLGKIPSDTSLFSFLPLKKLVLMLWKCLISWFGPDVSKGPPSQEQLAMRKTLSKCKPKDFHEMVKTFESKYVGSIPVASEEVLQVLQECVVKDVRGCSEEEAKMEVKKHTPRIFIPDASPGESLYRRMVFRMHAHCITLFKIMYASLPTMKSTYTGNINVTSDLDTVRVVGRREKALFDEIDMELEIARHREIILKGISGILLSLVLGFRYSHILQMEYFCQRMVDSKGLLLILKFLNQRSWREFLRKTPNQTRFDVLQWNWYFIPAEAPLAASASGGPHAPSSLNVEMKGTRNMFTAINLLHVLQKATKNHESRILVLKKFKAHAMLRKVVMAGQECVATYALKLLKSLVPYLGRRWRVGHMSLVSMIYRKVRLDVGCDWLDQRESVDEDAVNEMEKKEREVVFEFNRRNYIEWDKTASTTDVIYDPQHNGFLAASSETYAFNHSISVSMVEKDSFLALDGLP
eukprot:TRINITY_DN184_c7_g1_i2.p1 TRINITY_DN184_c7_g1~~TRINITY_DN184_c7_g1_i2.p1  ORF type:complete len:806 (-),score=231.14 TRINITY_DN184_c7_g1_i2:1557-3974(-)